MKPFTRLAVIVLWLIGLLQLIRFGVVPWKRRRRQPQSPQAMTPDDDFISEEDLQTFEGWLRYQQVSPETPEELATWRRLFEEARQAVATAPRVGRMKLQLVPGEYRYAVALRDG